MFSCVCWLVGLGATCPSGAAETARPEALVDLFMPAEFSVPRLSPDGAHLAFLARRGDTYAIGIINFASGHTDYFAGSGPAHPVSFRWKDARRLLVVTSQPAVDPISYLTYDVESGRTVDMDRLRHVGWQLMDSLPEDPKHVLMGSTDEVVLVSLETFHGEKISGIMPGTEEWILDPQGFPRAAIALDFQFGITTLWWRKTRDGTWETREFKAQEERFFPLTVTDDQGHLLGYTFNPSSKVSIARMETATGRIEPLPEFDGLDPAGIMALPRKRRLVAVTFGQGKTQKWTALDGRFAPGLARMEKQFPGYAADILDTTPDNKTWLVMLENSRLPGACVLYNTETGETRPLALVTGKTIAVEQLAPAEYFEFPRRDGTSLLSARLWRPANRARPPLIVFCPDSLPSPVVSDRFVPRIQAFVRLGYAVLSVNPRNSWGHGVASRQQSVDDWGPCLREDLEDGVHQLASQGIVDRSRVTLYGSGIAGVLALQVAAHSQAFAAVATVNIPSKMERNDLLALSTDSGIAPLAQRLGGWWASAKKAAAYSPVEVAPTLAIPALYLHDEESIQGRPIQAGREIRSAVKNAKAVAQTDLAYSWSEFTKLPSRAAREDAEVTLKVATFFEQMAAKPAGKGTSP